MNIRQALGMGAKKLMREGLPATGQVTEVKRCWWLKINTKPVRKDMWDGAIFPHHVFYRYQADGKEYEGSRIISAYAVPPKKGDTIFLYRHKSKPERSAMVPPAR